MLTQHWKLNITIIKIVAKKKKKDNRFSAYKAKNSCQKYQKNIESGLGITIIM